MQTLTMNSIRIPSRSRRNKILVIQMLHRLRKDSSGSALLVLSSMSDSLHQCGAISAVVPLVVLVLCLDQVVKGTGVVHQLRWVEDLPE